MLGIVNQMDRMILLAQIVDLKAEIEALNKAKTLEDPSGYCCNAMKEQLTYECDQHPDLTCPDIIITRSETFPLGWGGNPIVDVKVSPHYTLRGRNADYRAEFCPWCGTDLNYKAYRKDIEALFDEPGDSKV